MIIRLYPDLYIALGISVFVLIVLMAKYNSIKFFGDVYHSAQKNDRRMVCNLRKDGSAELQVGYLEGDKLFLKQGRKFIQPHTKETDEAGNEETKPMVFRLGKVGIIFAVEGKIVAHNPFKNIDGNLDQSTVARILHEESIRLDKRQKVFSKRKHTDIPVGMIFMGFIAILCIVAIWFGLPLILGLVGG